jgi:hypothetical protein
MAHKENICQEQECAESWSALSEDVRNHCTSFVYCPFCANEMVTRCSACGETLQDTDFNYCPWCGEQFE